jgi:predicted Zn-dependent peptidase
MKKGNCPSLTAPLQEEFIMFADPQSVTINSVAVSLPRISSGDQEATYRSADEIVQMRISHQDTKGRKRRMVRLDKTVIAADPLTAENASQKAGIYLVVDEPKFGFADADLDYLVDALIAWLTSGNIAKLLGGEA